MKKLLLAMGLLLSVSWTMAARIVVLTPDVADVVVALGATDEVVGRDVTTVNPALKNTATIGVFRQLSIEAISDKQPTIVLGSWMAQPQAIYEHLNRVGIEAVNVAPKDDLNDYPNSIIKIGKLIGKAQQAEQLATKWQEEMKQQPATGKRYLVSYDGRIVAGKNTATDELIRRAGGVNAAADIDGLKPMTREAWLAAKPDVIIISEHHQATSGGIERMLKRPEIANTPAGKNRAIYFLPAHDLFRYGLDTPQFLKRLNQLAK